jgi:hypothetical protein
MLYIGAEYCPYCAAERWPLVMALSKFGTFSNLPQRGVLGRRSWRAPAPHGAVLVAC